MDKLKGHKSCAFLCSWNPTKSLLVSSSCDEITRIWDASAWGRIRNDFVDLKSPFPKETFSWGHLVNSLEWSHDGEFLATSYEDGRTIIWNSEGQVEHTLCRFFPRLWNPKWSKRDSYLLASEPEGQVIVYDLKNIEYTSFRNHCTPVWDVDWRTDKSFASCSNGLIRVCKIGVDQPIQTYEAQKGNINIVKWMSNGQFLASSSDGGDLKVWHVGMNKFVYNLEGHTQKITALQWSPVKNWNHKSARFCSPILASASLDGTVKLWDSKRGFLKHEVSHGDGVTSIAFSPEEQYIASASFDKEVRIWCLKSGRLVARWCCDSAVMKISWNKTGDKIAASTGSGDVLLLDLRKFDLCS